MKALRPESECILVRPSGGEFIFFSLILLYLHIILEFMHKLWTSEPFSFYSVVYGMIYIVFND